MTKIEGFQLSDMWIVSGFLSFLWKEKLYILLVRQNKMF